MGKYEVKVDISEADNLLKSSNKNVFKAIKTGLTKSAFFLQGEVKSSIAGQRAELTSVDTGRFLNSVSTEVGNTDAIVYTNISYSKFLEYGSSRFRARRHFNNSKDRNKQKIAEIFQENIK